LEFVEGSILVIHNAAFDLGFLNAELKRASSKYPALEEICDVEDTLLMARNKFPGQRNSLDALANRFEIGGYDRSFHGALLDANILADVYIHLTGGQSKFEFMSSDINSNSESEISDSSIDLKKYPIPQIVVSKEDMLANDQRIASINAKRDSS
jgi:DNA polymerase-3 subunit epsilon